MRIQNQSHLAFEVAVMMAQCYCCYYFAAVAEMRNQSRNHFVELVVMMEMETRCYCCCYFAVVVEMRNRSRNRFSVVVTELAEIAQSNYFYCYFVVVSQNRIHSVSVVAAMMVVVLCCCYFVVVVMRS